MKHYFSVLLAVLSLALIVNGPAGYAADQLELSKNAADQTIGCSITKGTATEELFEIRS